MFRSGAYALALVGACVAFAAPVRIVLVGDSTVNPGGGWGPGFCAALAADVTCVNLAQNGRSSKSYLDEGLWKKALAEHGDYYLIQFGHNDQPGKGPERETEPETSFAANLRRYVEDARAQGAHPVLVTSLSRRNYKNGKLAVDALAGYAAATRHVAAAENVPLIDLYAMSTRLLGAMDQTAADQFDAPTHPDAKAENASATLDRTHLNPQGQRVFGRMVADALAGVCPELASVIQPTASDRRIR
jgi:lysophospholipase L1-like esterase